MQYLAKPLNKIYVTQPFGVNYAGPGAYDHNPSKKHAGIDFRAKMKTPIFAPVGGVLYYAKSGGKGGNFAELVSKSTGLRIYFGHLHSPLKDGVVQKGDRILLSGNSGSLTTGPHLHLGITPIFYGAKGDGPYRKHRGNGYRGYVDPKPYFDPDIFLLPVDKKYGEKKPHMTELQWYKANAYFFWVTKRLMTTKEKNALVYGCWDLRAVLDPAMHGTWTQMTKPAYLKKLGKL